MGSAVCQLPQLGKGTRLGGGRPGVCSDGRSKTRPKTGAPCSEFDGKRPHALAVRGIRVSPPPRQHERQRRGRPVRLSVRFFRVQLPFSRRDWRSNQVPSFGPAHALRSLTCGQFSSPIQSEVWHSSVAPPGGRSIVCTPLCAHLELLLLCAPPGQATARWAVARRRRRRPPTPQGHSAQLRHRPRRRSWKRSRCAHPGQSDRHDAPCAIAFFQVGSNADRT